MPYFTGGFQTSEVKAAHMGVFLTQLNRFNFNFQYESLVISSNLFLNLSVILVRQKILPRHRCANYLQMGLLSYRLAITESLTNPCSWLSCICSNEDLGASGLKI
jgi:hypothetical protein